MKHRDPKIQHFLDLRVKRKPQLEKNIPSIWNYNTVLYIGARTDRIDFGDEFKENNYKMDILEIFKPNVDYLKKIEWLNQIIEGDVKEVDKIIDKKYDVIFWWHGPEHIGKEDLKVTLDKLKKLANHYVVLGCPWGDVEQGDIFGNKWEEHVSELNLEDFEENGFKTDLIGEKDILGSNILAWWKNE